MAGSKRTFAYTLRPPLEDADRLLAKTRRVLAWACEGDDRIECQEVTGEALGVITMNLTITNRDQWACRQLAQDILNLVLWGLENASTKLDLDSKRQEAHTHRGYSHGRTKRTRSPKIT